MSYQVTARKWRPMVFEDVVGQSHVTATLRNAIASSRVAHAYIFSGQRGCGKTTTARILAKALNCLSPKDQNPDNACEVCKEITEGRSLDVIEIDGASNRGVEEIRNLREAVRYTPTRGKYKIYIIDEVHMLTKEAFNALLKTLEEPPAHVIFIFATTEVHKVPPTILSRCQRFDFRRIAIDEIIERLRFIAKEERVTIDDDALMVIAKKGEGSLRDAQSIFDQVRAFCGSTITTADALKTLNAVDFDVFFKLTSLIKGKDRKGGIELVDGIIRSGYDLREFVGGLSEHFRNLLVVASTGASTLVEASDHYRKKYEAEAKQFSENDLLRLMKLTNDLEEGIRWAAQPRYKLETGLLQMITIETSVRIEELLKQIDELKKRLDDGNGSPKAPISSDIKVMGTVSAGQLRSAAAMSVKRVGTTYSQPETRSVSSPVSSFSQAAVSATPQPQLRSGNFGLRSVSSAEAGARWHEWVGEVRKERIGVGSILDESTLLDVSNGAIRIACPDDYHSSTLKRHKEFLVESFRRLTGYHVLIEPVVQTVVPSGVPQAGGSNGAKGNGENGASVAGGGNGADKVQLLDPSTHPVVAALIRELGAEKVE